MLLPNLRGDGAVGMMLALAKGFSGYSHQVDLLIVRAEGERSSSMPDGVTVIPLRAKRPLFAVPALVRYLRRTKPDFLVATEHYSGLPALYAIILARTHTRCVIRQDNTWGMDSQRFTGRHKIVTPWMVGRLFRRSEIVAVSKGVARDFVDHFPQLANNVQVIYNPVVTAELRERSLALPEHPWLAPGEPPVVVAVGRLTAAKGFDLLIDAFARVTATVRSRLLILGEGPDRSALQARIRAHDLESACQLVGYQPNPLAFIASANVFVLSSRFEGLPTVLIEALCTNTPVIATDCPSGPREILADGKYGMLIPPNDVGLLAQAISESVRRPPPRDANLNAWLQQFAADTSVKRHLALFDASLASLPPS
ncbi:glycosyltransferase [Rhodanobacter ginsenosidimutans]|uniref:Glycosyltransferase n=1 Tax=Rhodanobacter ginsenosidimutans TaxID=490571 RepID=A0ABW0JWB3_9GAMM